MVKIKHFIQQSWLLIISSFLFGLLIAIANAAWSPRIEQNKIDKLNAEIVRKLRASSLVFRAYTEQRLIKVFGFIFNLIQANIFHHLYIMKMFDDEEYFIRFLSNLVEYARGYIQKENPFIIDS